MPAHARRDVSIEMWRVEQVGQKIDERELIRARNAGNPWHGTLPTLFGMLCQNCGAVAAAGMYRGKRRSGLLFTLV